MINKIKEIKMVRINFVIVFLLLITSCLFGQKPDKRHGTEKNDVITTNPNKLTGGWEQVLPRLPIQNYSGVWFRDSLTGFVNGDYGVIIKTTDGGIRWKVVSENDTRSYNRVNSLNGNYIVAVGQSGLFKQSYDGGDTWSYVAMDSSTNLWSIEYKKSGEVWVGGTNNVLIKTADNGITWKAIETSISSSYWDIKYYDDLNGVIGCDSGIVLRTEDGGKSWIKVQLPVTNSIYTIKYLTASKLVLGTDVSTFYYSEDGAKTWNLSQCTYLFGSAEALGFRDSLNGFCVLTNRDSHVETTDGGKSWRRIDPNMGNQYVYYVDSSLAYNIGYDMEFWKTTNGGRNWNRFISNDEIFDISVNGEDVILTYHWCLIRTNKTFYPLTMIPGSSGGIRLYFIDKNTGFLLGGGLNERYLLKTTSSGDTWKVVDSADIYRSVNRIQFINKNIGFYSSWNHLKKTTDGGETWVISFPTPGQNADYISAFTFLDENVGFCILDTLSYTTNGGATWQKYPFNQFHYRFPDDMARQDENKAWITGSNGTYVTNDKGATWQKREDANAYKIGFFDKKNGNILGGSYRLRTTSDGGATWIPDLDVQNIDFNVLRYGVNSDSSVDLYLAGKKGLVLRKKNAFITAVKESEAIENSKTNNIVTVYPNPFRSDINFNLPKNVGETVVELYNILGQRVYKNKYYNISDNNYKIQNLNYLSPGIYLLKININNKVYNKKILKVK